MNRTRFSLGIDEDDNKTEINLNKVDKKALKDFARGASEHNIEINKSDEWQNEDPDAFPDYNFRLRLNKYQVGLLKHVAKIEKRSLSNMIKSILINELEKYITKHH